jgi:hypothetical protein
MIRTENKQAVRELRKLRADALLPEWDSGKIPTRKSDVWGTRLELGREGRPIHSFVVMLGQGDGGD